MLTRLRFLRPIRTRNELEICQIEPEPTLVNKFFIGSETELSKNSK